MSPLGGQPPPLTLLNQCSVVTRVPGALTGITVSTAATLVEARALLTLTVMVPVSASVRFASVRVLESKPAVLQKTLVRLLTERPLERCHWRHNGLFSSAPTENLAVSPVWSVRLVCARTMMGGEDAITSEAPALFVEPKSLLMCAE